MSTDVLLRENDSTSLHDLLVVHKDEFTLERFRSVWASHTPIVVRGVHLDFQVRWTPDYFMERYGERACEVEDCETGLCFNGLTVSEYFQSFGQQRVRGTGTPILRLKDWPPRDNFSEVFPDLLDDFVKVVPAPDYCAPHGVFNLASHFPRNTVGPDLGPKIYNAYASVSDNDHNGSTRLHMDVADAVNIMTYASLTSNGEQGYALWHIFARHHAPLLRNYLGRRTKGARTEGDAIHNQDTYLTPVMLDELKQLGVEPYVIQQYVGDAVFIPAGCAHQVSNQADCMKIACDFVSPESAEMCQQIALDLRMQRLNVSGSAEEVLPVLGMLYYTWITLPLLEARCLDQYVRSLLSTILDDLREAPSPNQASTFDVVTVPMSTSTTSSTAGETYRSGHGLNGSG
ncbi:hypothetical protein C8T65DRAFT_587239 [Cerioporus squamosus]|nr:hypothetical protein C8T65DRAFT_587239 [Cerioporus squamosus]